MNEIRDLIVGIDFGKECTQLCYFDRKAQEPRSLSIKVGGSQFETPNRLCWRIEQRDFMVGPEAEYFAREKNGVLVEDLYKICEKEQKVQIAGEAKAPYELLAAFLEGMLKFLGVMDVVQNTKCLVLTAPSLSGIQVQNFQKACALLGFPEEKYMLMDYSESFYYYAMTLKRETWNRSVGWYAFAQNHLTFRKMTINGAVRPAIVKLTEAEEMDFSGEEELRDEEFCKFIQKTLGTEIFSSIQITGQGFDQEWAKQSVKMLCFQRRKVFYGNNLFARGACAAGKERLEDKRLKAYRYLSDALVTTDIGMDMRVMGSPVYYPLIEGGRNWYECKGSCELILDDTQELIFVMGTLGGSEKKRVAMQLPGLPKRPNRTTRLSLNLSYISRKECRILVQDMGFGDMYPSSGKTWKETVHWQEGEES